MKKYFWPRYRAVGIEAEGRTSWKVMEVHRKSSKVMEPDGRFGLSDQV